MNGVHITCQDAMTVIKQWDSPQTFFYLDPPYPKTDQGRYRGYSVADFNNLVDVVKDCKGSAMLSCYASDEFEIPSDWDRFDFVARCSVSSKGCVGVDRSSDSDRKDLGNTKRIETVYRKGSSVKPRREIQKQYDKGAFDCFQDVGFSRKNCLQDSLFK
jgi:site-specific DNA-adenine methylase